MKKIYLNILAAVIFMFSGYSCSAGWLDLEPSDEARGEEVIENLKDAEIALNGVYAMIKGHRDPGNITYREYYMAAMLYYGDVRADDIQAHSASSGRPDWLYDLTFIGTSGADNMWYIPYKVIYRANRLMKYIEEGAVKDAKKEDLDNLVGQALMARAMAHFDLLRVYSLAFDVKNNGEKLGVPIVIDVHGFTYKPKRNTINEVYTRILEDLEDAVKLMKPSNGAGYFNSWAGKALQARVYQYMGDEEETLKKSLEIAEDIIDKSPYNLWANKDYLKAWASDPVSQEATEAMFEIMITSNTDWTDREGIAYLYSHDGYADLHVTKKFYDMINEDYAGDVRLGLLLATDDEDVDANVRGKNVWLNKYGPKEGSTDMRISNIPLLRLSETYLIAAESAVKLGKISVATEYLNKILLRGNPNAIALAESEVTLERILKEKRVELFGEGLRYFDLIRNNLDVERHNVDGSDIGWHRPLRVESMKYDRNFFRAILPIPKSEMDANSGLKGQQNAGY